MPSREDINQTLFTVLLLSSTLILIKKYSRLIMGDDREEAGYDRAMWNNDQDGRYFARMAANDSYYDDYYNYRPLEWTPDPNFTYIEPVNISVKEHLTLKPKSKIKRVQFIPKILHQMWDSYDVPNIYIPWIINTIRKHPSWEYWFWVKEDMDCYLKHKHPDKYHIYTNYSSQIFRSDFLRYFVLYDYGGLYMDLDVEVLKPMDPWLYISPSIISYETYEHFLFVYYAEREYPNLINTILLTAPRHRYYSLLQSHLEEYQKLYYDDVLRATGPLYIDAIMQKYLHQYNVSSWTLVTYGRDNRVSRHQLSSVQTANFTSTNISLIHPRYWLSTFDPFRKEALNTACTIYENMDDFMSVTHPRFKQMRKDVCNKQIKDRFSNCPHPDAYLDHHWVHSYAKNRTEFFERNTTRVDNIIPGFKSVSQRLGFKCV